MNRELLKRIERSYRIQRWVAGAILFVAVYLLVGCVVKSSYLAFKGSPLQVSGFIENVFYQIYSFVFVKPLGEDVAIRLWSALPVFNSMDLFVRDNLVLLLYYLAVFIPAGHFRLCSARIARLNRLEADVEDEAIRNAYRGVPPGRADEETSTQPQVDRLWTRREKSIDRYFAPLAVGLILLLAQFFIDRFA